MKTNKIGWCHSTINPIVGCTMNCTFTTKEGKGSKCYARRQAKRQKQNCLECYNFTPHLHLERLKWVTPHQEPQRIFVGSMADIADFVDMVITPQQIPLPTHHYLIEPMAAAIAFGKEGLRLKELLSAWFAECKQHTFLILTKRPMALKWVMFPDNVWVGVTVTRHNEQVRFHSLVETGCSPAGNYFVSFEPLLEKIYWDIQHFPKWAIIGGLSRTGRDPIPPQRDWLVRLASYFKTGEINTPIYLKENAQQPGFPDYREFPPGFPVYENEVSR